jgi:S1-C subfamily serine protease
VVVWIDEVHDLALLKTERPLLAGPDSPPYAALDPSEATEGADVWVSGHPEFSWQPVTQAGHVVRRRRVYLAGENEASSDAVEIDLRLRLGNSGSPVYRPGGGVIAVVDQRDALQPAHSVAVAIHYAIELADRLGVKWYDVK